MQRMAELIERCKAWYDLHRNYMRRRFLWWYMHCFKRRIFFEKFKGRKGLREFEGVAMKKLVVRFWKHLQRIASDGVLLEFSDGSRIELAGLTEAIDTSLISFVATRTP